MIRPKYSRYTLLTIRIIVGFIFLLSGTGKLIDSGYVNYDLVRLLSNKFFWIIEYAAHIIISLSIVELVIAILLLWNRWLTGALIGAFVCLLSFSGILGYFYLHGTSVASCGCFGAFGFASGIEFTLIRNIVLLILLGIAFMLQASGKSTVVTEAT